MCCTPRSIIFIFFIVPLFSSQAIAVEPLSCRMQILLHITSAISRDQGTSREATTKALRKDGELTQGEIKEIVTNVYIKYKNKSADEIGTIVGEKCK